MSTADTYAEFCQAVDGETTSEETITVAVDTLEAFSAVEEPGAKPLIGDSENVMIPEGGDVMVFGAGGSAKTTLMLDAACHLGAGQDWIGLPIPHALRVLMVEVEGPRPLFRAKLRRKLKAWDGDPIGERVLILREPWAKFTFAAEEWRKALARMVDEQEVDVVIVGPLARIGMDSAGTLQEVRDFMHMVDDVRERCARRIAVVLIHHENRAGTVSGAWEGAGDTLLHVREAGPGHTLVHVQKARWASDYHGTTIKLAWAPGESFKLEAERDLLAEIKALLADGKWRITEEIRKELGVGKDTISDLLKEHADDFRMVTGEDARALGRSKAAQLYQVAS